MKLWKLVCGVAAMVYLPLAMAAAPSPAGTWTTIDDKTGAKRALVRLTVLKGTLSGTIEKVYPQPGDTGICSKCPGTFKGKKIQGIEFIWGLRDEGNGVWSGGSILDPKTGKIYKAKVTLLGDKLLVRGYVGISLLGRTQTWVR
jgi:uncharacterized protein (DUF2147 family)